MADAGRRALLNGGPLDGQVIGVEEDKDELLVTMADGTVHRYRRTRAAESPASTTAAAVFEWNGRESL